MSAPAVSPAPNHNRYFFEKFGVTERLLERCLGEALSAGDTIFQHRCVRRIKEMQDRGVTVLFVSHEPTLVRALCSRAILLYKGEAIADGPPVAVLNRYQRLIMAREAAYKAGDNGAVQAATLVETQAVPGEDSGAPLSYQYRHGNGDAEVIYAELLDADEQPLELVETGDLVYLRMRFLFHRDVARPVCGFMIRSRHGMNVYGTNTEQRGLELGEARRGDIVEATFAFNCWLGQEHYFVSVAVHSPDGAAYDWLDGVIFFRVACAVEMEGLANLNARVAARRVGASEVTNVVT